MARDYSVGFQLRTDTARWRRDLGRAKRDWREAVGTMSRGGRRLALVTAGLTTGFLALARTSIRAADAQAKAARNAGLSARAYQELAHVFERAGSSGNVLSKATQTLQRRILDGERGLKEALDSFRDIGVSWETLSELSPEQAFLRTLDALRGVADEGRRLALAQRLLGRAGRELANVLAQSNEEIEEQRRRLRDLGGVLSGPLAKRAEDFEDAITDAGKVVRTQFTAAILESLGPVGNWDSLIKDVGNRVRSGTRFVVGMARAVWNWRGGLVGLVAIWASAKTVIFGAATIAAVVSLSKAVAGLAAATLALKGASVGGLAGLAGIAAVAGTGGLLAALPSRASSARSQRDLLTERFEERERQIARFQAEGRTARVAAMRVGQEAALREIKRLGALAGASDNTNRLQDVLDRFNESFQRTLSGLTKGIQDAVDQVGEPEREPIRGVIRKAFDRVVERLNVVQRFPEGSPRASDLQRDRDELARLRRERDRVNFPSRFPEGSPRGSGLGRPTPGRRINFREIGGEFRDALQRSLSDALATGNWDNVGDALLASLSRSFADRVSQGLTDFLDPLIEGIFGSLEDSISGAATKSAGSIFSELGSIFSGLFSGLGGLLSGILSGIGSAFGGLTFHDGGRVPGRPGQEVPAVLEAGELVIPADEAGFGAGGVQLNFQVIGDVTEATRKVLREDIPEIAAGVHQQFRESGVLP